MFIAKLIINRPKVFQPYAKFWLSGLTQFIVRGEHGGRGLHSFAVDLVVTVLSWSSVAVLEVRIAISDGSSVCTSIPGNEGLNCMAVYVRCHSIPSNELCMCMDV